MKTLLPLLTTCFFVLFTCQGTCQWVNIPDTSFGKWLNSNGYNQCLQGSSSTGWQLDTTCTALVTADTINCSYQDITSLEGIGYFKNATLLMCYNNKIVSLNELPPNLETLFCNDNQLVSIGRLPSTLTTLNCNNNNLVTLPALPYSLTNLDCAGNLLVELPYMPDSLGFLNITDNSSLLCLPSLNKVKQLYFAFTGFDCVPNYPVGPCSSYPNIYSLPICDVFNSNGCQPSWNVTGKVFKDTEGVDCYFENEDYPIETVKVRLYENGILSQQTFSNSKGEYAFQTSTGSFVCSIDSTDLPFTLTCPSTLFHSAMITPTDTFDGKNDFSLKEFQTLSFDLTCKGIVPMQQFFPTQFCPLRVIAGNNSMLYPLQSLTGISGSVSLSYSGPVKFISPMTGALPPIVSGKTLTWNISDFSTISSNVSFNVIIQTDTIAQAGIPVCFTLSISSDAGDVNLINNTFSICFVTVNSFDPNDKQVYPVGDIDTAQKDLVYTIRFQNTGTAAAKHIFITDTLDGHLDPNSFQLLSYSHQPLTQIKGNAVRFNFSNINLPDSTTNEPESHGFIQYKVKLKDNLAVGTQILNTAYIYFDFNEPVVTNTTVSTVSINTTLSSYFTEEDVTVQVFPNPANNTVTVLVSENLVGAKFSLTDVSGREIASLSLQGNYTNISLSMLTSGIYFATITDNNGRRILKKLLKQ